MLRAVFLDVDDTLVDFDRAARASLGDTLGADVDYGLWRTLEHYRRYESGELAIFEHACDVLGVAANEAMHVGDNLVADARGARGAGLLGVWMDRGGEDRGARRDLGLGVTVISGLAQLADLVT